MNRLVVPILTILVALGWLLRCAIVPSDPEGEAKIREFGRFPVVYQGRVKPFDTLARNSLLIISGRQTFRMPVAGNEKETTKEPAIRWLLDSIAHPDASHKHQVFRITHPQVLETIGVLPRDGFRYAPEEFRNAAQKIDEESNRARSVEAAYREVYDRQMLEFAEKAHLYRLLVEAHMTPLVRNESMREDLEAAVRHFQMLKRFSLPHAIPPKNRREDWKPFLRAVVEMMVDPSPDPATAAFSAALISYGRNDVKEFNRSVDEYQRVVRGRLTPSEIKRLDFEVFFNHFEPFYRASVLYVGAFLMTCLSWLFFREKLRQSALALTVLAFFIHSFAIISRIWISGYPPVTNLYSSAVFIGWGCAGLGIGLEVLYKMGAGTLVATVSGFLTLVIAHFLAGDGDTMEMMQAVLDTRFWLATHVTTVTLGYTSTFVAGLLALVFVFRGVFTPTLDKNAERNLGRMIYGVLGFALLLSFVGTVLGGLWADDSWGRFWGWDPKENGALIIVLWNALILHARWAGRVRARGMAVLSIFGNIVTAWSWFGVNQLGVGLHSYGFTDSAAFWLIVFVGSQLGALTIGCVPRRFWRSC
ncbi:MAG: cytochrome c biogenesis protein CcsA [Planctomycetota bacterium]